MTARRAQSSLGLASCLAAVALLTAAPAFGLEARAVSGPVSARVLIEPDAPVIGDALTLEIEAIAEPEVEVLMPEFGEALDRFSITNFVPRESLDDQGRTVSTQRYTLQLSASGEYTLPSILIEFIDRRPGRAHAPDDSDAYELVTDPISFHVESVVVDAASADLSPPLGELDRLGASRTQLAIWVAIALAVLAALAPFALRAYARWRAQGLRQSAYEIARGDLDALLASPTPTEDEIDSFVVNLSSIVRTYLENRFELRSPELTTEEFMVVVSASPDLGRPLQDLLRHFLEQADLVKFAHIIPSPETIAELTHAASRFLDDTRDDLRGAASGTTPLSQGANSAGVA